MKWSIFQNIYFNFDKSWKYVFFSIQIVNEYFSKKYTLNIWILRYLNQNQRILKILKLLKILEKNKKF